MIVATSRIYSTKAWGMRGQPNYANMVIGIETKLPAQTVLTYCQRIEKKQQRVRKIHWGSRTLDIDLLLYGTQRINSPTLTVPHPRMLSRDFVMIPLSEISCAQYILDKIFI